MSSSRRRKGLAAVNNFDLMYGSSSSDDEDLNPYRHRRSEHERGILVSFYAKLEQKQISYISFECMLHFQMYEDLIYPTAEENEQPPSMVIQQDAEKQGTEPQVNLSQMSNTFTFNE